MVSYSVQSRDRIFVKGYGFLSFAKNKDKNIGRSIVKIRVLNTARNFLIMLKNLQQIHLKLLQKEQLKKQLKQLVI